MSTAMAMQIDAAGSCFSRDDGPSSSSSSIAKYYKSKVLELKEVGMLCLLCVCVNESIEIDFSWEAKVLK
jgi:hypothetical protein